MMVKNILTTVILAGSLSMSAQNFRQSAYTLDLTKTSNTEAKVLGVEEQQYISTEFLSSFISLLNQLFILFYLIYFISW